MRKHRIAPLLLLLLLQWLSAHATLGAPLTTRDASLRPFVCVCGCVCVWILWALQQPSIDYSQWKNASLVDYAKDRTAFIVGDTLSTPWYV